jgi:hypothetical protein
LGTWASIAHADEDGTHRVEWNRERELSESKLRR